MSLMGHVATDAAVISGVADAAIGAANVVRGSSRGAPRNAHLAGGTHPRTGVPFNSRGFPDFKAAEAVSREVRITQTGTRAGDFRAANEAAGFSRTPEGFTWHHHEDGVSMQLVERDIHASTGHTGGFSPGP